MAGGDEEKPSTPAYLRYGALCLLVIQDTALVLLMRYSRSRPHTHMYVASTAVASMESVKLLSCLLVLWWTCNLSLRRLARSLLQNVLIPREVLKASIPAALYFAQNNLLYFALSHLRATPYKVIYNLKIFTGALCSVLILRHKLSNRRWISLLFLFIGVVVVQSNKNEKVVTLPTSTFPPSNLSASGDHALPSSDEMQQYLGFLAVVVAACTSGFCGVYQQLILQDASVSMWERNIQLGLPSVMTGVVVMVVNDGAQVWRAGVFSGYDSVVCGVICLQAIGGLLVAFILKYADNILKNFAAAFSTLMSCLLEMALFGFRPSPVFLCGAVLINVAAYMYNTQPTPKVLPVTKGQPSHDDSPLSKIKMLA